MDEFIRSVKKQRLAKPVLDVCMHISSPMDLKAKKNKEKVCRHTADVAKLRASQATVLKLEADFLKEENNKGKPHQG